MHLHLDIPSPLPPPKKKTTQDEEEEEVVLGMINGEIFGISLSLYLYICVCTYMQRSCGELDELGDSWRTLEI